MKKRHSGVVESAAPKKFNTSTKASDSFIKRASRRFLSALFPENVTCDKCGAELIAPTRYPLCADCLSKLPLIDGHICSVCGVPVSDEADYCLRCQNTKSYFEINRSPLCYEGTAKGLIYAMKFGGKRYISKTLGAMMSDCFVKYNMKADVAVFVPMTKREKRGRGFNQAQLLANEVSERLRIEVVPALDKVRETRSQKALGAKARAENMKGVFALSAEDNIKQAVKGKNVLIIDDVFTTGATANECARILLNSGRASRVSVLTAAITKRGMAFERQSDE